MLFELKETRLKRRRNGRQYMQEKWRIQAGKMKVAGWRQTLKLPCYLYAASAEDLCSCRMVCQDYRRFSPNLPLKELLTKSSGCQSLPRYSPPHLPLKQWTKIISMSATAMIFISTSSIETMNKNHQYVSHCHDTHLYIFH